LAALQAGPPIVRGAGKRDAWLTYYNDRFGFALDYPAEEFTAEMSRFYSPDPDRHLGGPAVHASFARATSVATPAADCWLASHTSTRRGSPSARSPSTDPVALLDLIDRYPAECRGPRKSAVARSPGATASRPVQVPVEMIAPDFKPRPSPQRARPDRKLVDGRIVQDFRLQPAWAHRPAALTGRGRAARSRRLSSG
jgi:hypothetical protein